MSKWKQIFEGERRPDLEDKIFHALRGEVEKNRPFSLWAWLKGDGADHTPMSRRAFFPQLAGLTAALAAVSFYWFRLRPSTPGNGGETAQVTPTERARILADPELPTFEPEMLTAAPVLANYDLLADYDVIERWEVS
ncbi:MAG: hypothetical protein AB7P04_04800 [Bacteriovoracia bacterium]